MSHTPKNQPTLLSPSLLTRDQNLGVDRLFENDATLLVGGLGYGKTVCTLTAIAELLGEGVITKVLVLAPLKVAKTIWAQEAAKWEHLAHLKIGVATGPPNVRREVLADPRNDIVVINYENLIWFCDTIKDKHEFDGLVCDEITKLKSSGGSGFKKLRHRLHKFNWRVGLSGTPVSEDFESLYAMSFILDSGKRLGTRKDLFLRKYFYATDYMEYNWELLDDTGETLMNCVSDLIYIPDNEAYTKSLPALHEHTVDVTMPPAAWEIYEGMKNTAIAGINGAEISADNAAVVVGKLSQVANGFLYEGEKPDRITHRVHMAKITACAGLVAEIDRPLIIAYWFEADLVTLKTEYPHAVTLDGKNDDEVIRDWNAGKVPVLLLHPRSASHGLQLEQGGHDLIIYSPFWSRDITLQLIARLHRQGQKHDVNVYTLCAVGTVDKLIMERVKTKAGYEELLAGHLG